MPWFQNSASRNRFRVRLMRERIQNFLKNTRIGTENWRTFMSRMRFNPGVNRRRVVLRKVLGAVLTLRAVNVNWNDDGWNVNANSVENPNEWNADNRVFSRNSLSFSCRSGGSFHFQPSFPATEHATDFVKLRR